MKINFSTLVPIQPTLRKLTNTDLPVKTAYALRKFILKVGDELKVFEEQRVALLKTYGEQKGDNFEIPEEKQPELIGKLNELLALETDFDFTPIELNALPENLTLSVAEVDLLVKANVVSAS